MVFLDRTKENTEFRGDRINIGWDGMPV